MGVGDWWDVIVRIGCELTCPCRFEGQKSQTIHFTQYQGLYEDLTVFCLMGSRWVEPKVGMFMSELWLGCPKTQSVTIQGSC